MTKVFINQKDGALYWPNGDFIAACEGVDALREYFRDERDRELGRWRWPENPDYVVTPRTQKIKDRRVVRVFRESTGNVNDIREVEPICRSDDSLNAARAYFDAHPEKKPWHDAKEGEVWLMQTEENEYVVVANMMNRGVRFRDNDKAGSIFDPKSSAFTGGRRIWPESKES